MDMADHVLGLRVAEGYYGNDYPEDPSSNDEDEGDGEDSGDDDDDGYPRPSRRGRQYVIGDDYDFEDEVGTGRYYIDDGDDD